MNELSLFAGAGGGILGGKLLGWQTVCAVEIDEYCQRILMQRQDDGILKPFPIWDDIKTFNGKPWARCVDIVTGGFPCQDISCAGKGAGITGERSGLWIEMARVIREVGPRFVLVENSPMLTVRGLGVVLGDLASMGYDAQWGVFGARHAGAPHRRDRIWIVANSDSQKQHDGTFDAEMACPSESMADNTKQRWRTRRARRSDSSDTREPEQPLQIAANAERSGSQRIAWWKSEPGMGRVADGVAHRVDRLRALGNGQVSGVVELAWNHLAR